MSWYSSPRRFNSPIIDVTEDLKSIDINKAREIGVELHSVDVTRSIYDQGSMEVLRKNMGLWIDNEPDLVKHMTKDLKNEKYRGVRSRKSIHTYYFSKFKLIWYISEARTTRMDFRSLSEDELLAYSDSDNLVAHNKTPSILQIAFGIREKYPLLGIRMLIYDEI